jgi:hypothetical protein
MIEILKAKAVIHAVTGSVDSFDETDAWLAMVGVNTAQQKTSKKPLLQRHSPPQKL